LPQKNPGWPSRLLICRRIVGGSKHNFRC